jgi:UDP:flavonoid glycosyltransferase YjiC (YdhE family)
VRALFTVHPSVGHLHPLVPVARALSDAVGVATTVGPEDRTPEAIRDAVRQVLGDPSYSANARDFQGDMIALPGPEHMVELLEELTLQPT